MLGQLNECQVFSGVLYIGKHVAALSDACGLISGKCAKGGRVCACIWECLVGACTWGLRVLLRRVCGVSVCEVCLVGSGGKMC